MDAKGMGVGLFARHVRMGRLQPTIGVWSGAYAGEGIRR